MDYESQPQGFQLNVRARDGGSPPLSRSVQVHINLIDVNDNPPRFFAASYQETVSEDVAVGHSITTVNAHDPDAGENSRIAFRLENYPAGMPIRLDPDTGLISTTSRLDRETAASYSFQVVAYDHGTPPQSALASVDITVRDVNDNHPVFDPSVYHVVVSEEAIRGTPVQNVFATDDDADERLDYSISAGNVDGAFDIISQLGSGLISVARPLDYKKQSRYILTVTATDSGGSLATATVYINVSDANTFAPVFQNAPYDASISEEADVGATVIRVSATDGDVGQNARIVYSMTLLSMFSIKHDTGEIFVR